MKLSRVLLTLALLLGSAFAGALEPGEPMPDLRGSTLLQPGQLELSSLRGKVVYVDVWASWCTPCQVALPRLQQWHEKYAAEGFTVVGLNVDTDLKAARNAARRAGLSYPNMYGLSDADLSGLGMQTMPTGYLLDRQGRVQLVHEGFRKRDAWPLEKKIQEALKQ